MTTPATPLDRAKRVIDLDKHATKPPWSYEFAYNNGGLPTGDLKCPGRNDGFTVELLEIDCLWITETRTLSVALAADVTQLTAEYAGLAEQLAEEASHCQALAELLKRALPYAQHDPQVADLAQALGLLPAVKEESDG